MDERRFWKAFYGSVGSAIPFRAKLCAIPNTFDAHNRTTSLGDAEHCGPGKYAISAKLGDGTVTQLTDTFFGPIDRESFAIFTISPEPHFG